MTEQTHEEAIREIWNLFKETDARLDRRFAKTDARLDRRFAETDARLDRRFAETDRRFAELDRKLEERDARLDRRIREVYGMFAGQWGRMMEALVKPDAIRLFQQRGIPVKRIYQRAESQLDGRSMEMDLILENDADIVIIEVKSTLRVQQVRNFLDDLDEFLTFFPRYREYRIYGGVAGMDISENADRFAYRRGLFVLHVAGEGLVEIMNDEPFEPKDFGNGEKTRPSD